MDHRDTQTWIALELTPLGEFKVEEGTLASSLRRDLGVDPEHPVFVPATTYHKAGKLITVHLMEGYCFVATGLPEVRYFQLERTGYIASVMSTQSGPYKIRTLSVLPDREIKRLRKQLSEQLASDIEEMAWVTVTRGKFKGLVGQVMYLLNAEYAFVHFKLRSLIRVTPIPRVFLETTAPPTE